MKRIAVLLIAIVIVFVFAGCSGNGDDPKVTATPEASTTEPTLEPTAAATKEPDPTTDISDMVNVALGKPVEEHGNAYRSVYWHKDFLTDGFKMEDDIEGQTTGWMSEASQNIDDETWVYVNLEEVFTVEAVAIYPRESEMFFPSAYEIQLSLDGENWTSVKSVKDDWGYLETDRLFAIEASQAQYVRIFVKERYDVLPGFGINGYIAELSEIEVYAKDS